MDMVNDQDVKVDQYNMVKQEFIQVLQPLAPKVTCKVDNIRGKFSIEVLNQKKPLAVLRKKHIFAKLNIKGDEYEYSSNRQQYI